MEDNITEKFALLNLIKALQGLSADDKRPETESKPQEAPAPVPEKSTDEFNAMASVLARHEVIANRVKNRK